MWIWVIIIAVIIGGLIGFIASDGNSTKEDTLGGMFAGGCMAAGCLVRIAIAALIIMAILWLFNVLF